MSTDALPPEAAPVVAPAEPAPVVETPPAPEPVADPVPAPPASPVTAMGAPTPKIDTIPIRIEIEALRIEKLAVEQAAAAAEVIGQHAGASAADHRARAADVQAEIDRLTKIAGI